MFKRILSKKRRAAKGQRDSRTPLATFGAQHEPAPRTPVTPPDDSFAALARELSGLGQMEVSRAAKERGWVSLQRELERRPVRPAAAQAKQNVQPVRRWRWAIVSTAAFVAVIAGVLGAYGAGAFQAASSVVVTGSSSTTTSVLSSSTTQPNTTEPSTSVTTPSTTPVTQPSTTQPGPGTTAPRPSTTQSTQSSTTESTHPTSPSTTQPGTNTTQPGTSTTQPGPTTTGEQQYAAKLREGSAVAAAAWLANLVITGDTSGANAMVDPSARSSLAQMIMSLKAPFGYVITGKQALSGDSVRVTLVIQDRVENGQGVTAEKDIGFVINVRVTAQGAVVTAINAGS